MIMAGDPMPSVTDVTGLSVSVCVTDVTDVTEIPIPLIRVCARHGENGKISYIGNIGYGQPTGEAAL